MTPKLDLVITGRVPAVTSSKKITNLLMKGLVALDVRRAEIGVAFLGPVKMAEKNKEYRRMNKPTDVLSFSYSGKRNPMVGDILICMDYAAKQAKASGIPVGQELNRLLIHGILHLAGFDHMNEQDAQEMFSLQESLI